MAKKVLSLNNFLLNKPNYSVLGINPYPAKVENMVSY